MANKSGRMNFEKILLLVRDDPETVFEKHARMLSDLSQERTAQLRAVLSGITAEKKASFYRKMADTGSEYYEYDFSPIAEIGLDDENHPCSGKWQD